MGTNMSDDYLFDGSGTPDPDIERLERMLGRLRSTASAPPIATDGERRTANDERPYLGARFYVPALAAAFLDVLVSPEGQAVLRRRGFQPPPAGAR